MPFATQIQVLLFFRLLILINSQFLLSLLQFCQFRRKLFSLLDRRLFPGIILGSVFCTSAFLDLRLQFRNAVLALTEPIRSYERVTCYCGSFNRLSAVSKLLISSVFSARFPILALMPSVTKVSQSFCEMKIVRSKDPASIRNNSSPRFCVKSLHGRFVFVSVS